MKKKIFVASLFSAFLLISCKKEEEVQQPVEAKEETQPFSGEEWLKQRVSVDQPSQQQQPVQQTQQGVQTQTQTPPGMNPPHGQPGHRCDIAVGAPLNSKPAQNNQPQAAQVVNTKPSEQPVMKVNTSNGSTTIVGTSTPPGMNPPHGQEGHRCDIAVGAPLPKE